MSIKFYHLSDVHLGAVSAYVPDLLKIQFLQLNKIAENAMKNNISTIVIAGDLFDSPDVASSIVNQFKNFVSKYPSLEFIVSSGTHGHDSLDNDQSVFKRSIFQSFPENFIFLETQSDYAYINKSQIAFYSEKYDKAVGLDANHHVLLFHGSPADIALHLSTTKFRKFDYVAMGHFHYFQIFKTASLLMAYAGSMVAFEAPKGKEGINESTFALVDLTNQSDIVSKMQSSHIKIIRKFIASEKELKDLEESIAQGDLDKETRLTIFGKAAYREELEEKINNLVYSLAYEEINLMALPEIIISALDNVLAKQTAEDIPWADVKEYALKLISGEEGIDFLSPQNYFQTQI